MKAQEAREAAEAKREEEKAKRLQAEMEAAEAAEAAAKATQAAKEAATAREEQDDAKYIARGCLDNSVYRLIFGPRKPASERKPCPENLPSAEVGIECMGKTEADVIPGKHWCCKHSDWRKQCIADCKGQGHTEPGNECFVKCRVDVLYTKVPGAWEDPDHHRRIRMAGSNHKERGVITEKTKLSTVFCGVKVCVSEDQTNHLIQSKNRGALHGATVTCHTQYVHTY